VLLGGAERGPLPHPPRGPEISSPAPPAAGDKATTAEAPAVPSLPLPLRPRPGGPSSAGSTQRAEVAPPRHSPVHGPACRRFLPTVRPTLRVAQLQFILDTCLTITRSLVPQRRLQIHAQGNGGGGGGDAGQRSPSKKRPTTKEPLERPPSSGKSAPRLSYPRAVRLVLLLTPQVRRSLPAAPPQTVTARHREREHSPPPPSRGLLLRGRARLAAQASLVVRKQSDWPKVASIKTTEAPGTPPPAGDSLRAVKPRAGENPDKKKPTQSFRD
jgi:hypothetical protein